MGSHSLWTESSPYWPRSLHPTHSEDRARGAGAPAWSSPALVHCTARRERGEKESKSKNQFSRSPALPQSVASVHITSVPAEPTPRFSAGSEEANRASGFPPGSRPCWRLCASRRSSHSPRWTRGPGEVRTVCGVGSSWTPEASVKPQVEDRGCRCLAQGEELGPGPLGLASLSCQGSGLGRDLKLNFFDGKSG